MITEHLLTILIVFSRAFYCSDIADGQLELVPHLARNSQKDFWNDLEPEFDTNSVTDVTTVSGRIAYLTCRVKNLGNRTVSWVRHRDVHILTAGSYTYTSDQRFQALHRITEEWSEWTLCVKWVQMRDSGIYECQLSTIPVLSHTFHLNVVVSRVKILSGPDLYVDAGSNLVLTCVIEHSREPPHHVIWYYNRKKKLYSSYGSSDGKSVHTETGNDTTTSKLFINYAVRRDSGEYTCRASNSEEDSVRVHVLNEDQPEAMQTGNAVTTVFHLSLIVVTLTINRFFILS